ncbi:MAG: hypothetical protein R3C43_19740 [Chloroflexota bacterium]
MQRWRRRFHWSDDGTQIVGRTVCGRATVVALSLNNLIAVTVRRIGVVAGWHRPAGATPGPTTSAGPGPTRRLAPTPRATTPP